jgi:glycosyltransferase involved in cell wall biosynthesis
MEGRGCASCLTDTVETDLILAQRTVKKKASFSLDARPDAPLDVRMWAVVRSRDYSALRTEPRLRPGPLQAPLVVEGSLLPQRAPLYRRRREGIIDLINRYVDVALSVSQRTAKIYEDYGVRRERLHTLYIGSDAALFQAPSCNPAPRSPGDLLRLVYLGESRREKGFHFLLHELRQLPADTLRSLDLTIACRVTDQAELRMAAENRGLLLSLAEALGRFTYLPGYTRENLPSILQGVHLGIVPALWEDNLPQVTLELLAYRVPVLCSDRGGAQEFVRHPAFIYDPDTAGDFRSRLRNVEQDSALLDDFWSAAWLPKSMDQHFAELVDVYIGPTAS